ncbi:sensor histidine kinase [bacterium]|nr:sensor histidine kinase [bacterium]
MNSLINLQMRVLDDEGVKTIFRDTQNRIRSMAMIHEKLIQSDSLIRIDFGQYIQDLCRALLRTFAAAESGVRMSVDAEPVHVPLKIAVPCGLVINELFSNVLKYAFPEPFEGQKEVHITFKENDGQLELIMRDNGVGKRTVRTKSDTSLGRELVELLIVQQLNGSMNIETDQGTRIVLHIPLE